MRITQLLMPLALALLIGGRLALALPKGAGGEHTAEAPVHTGEPDDEHMMVHDEHSETPVHNEPDEGDVTVHVDGEEPDAVMPKHHLKPSKIMGDLDSNHDGKISREELVARLKQVNKELGCARRARASRRGAAAARAESSESRLQ